jgi:hypothetical protein
MRRFRFHLGTLVILILFLGVGLAALRESNDTWDSGIFSIMLGILLFSMLFAVHRTDSRRAFWLGFTLLGWIYLGLSLIPPIEIRLITTKALHYLYSKLPDDAVVVTSQAGRNVTSKLKEHTISAPFQGLIVKNKNQYGISPAYYAKYTAYKTKLRRLGSGKTENFVRIGHSLVVLLTAWFGGQVSRYLWTKNRQRNVGRATSAGVDLE